MVLKIKYWIKPIAFFLLATWALNPSVESYSQDIPVVSDGEFKFYFDTCSFGGKGDTTYQEFYLMFHADQLNVIDFGIKNIVGFNVLAELFNESGKQISSKEWISDVKLNQDSTELKYLVVFDQWSQFFAAG